MIPTTTRISRSRSRRLRIEKPSRLATRRRGGGSLLGERPAALYWLVDMTIGRVARLPLHALVAHRQAIRIFVGRDIRGRYINSVLGLWWAVIQPLTLLLLYTFVFSRVMNLRLSEGAGEPASSPCICSAVCFRGWRLPMPSRARPR